MHVFWENIVIGGLQINIMKSYIMKILFLTPYVPSKVGAVENFTRLLLEDLSRNNVVDLIYYKYSQDSYYESSNANIRVLKVLHNSTFVKIRNALKHPFTHPTFTIRFDGKLLNYVRHLINSNDYDILYLDHSQMAHDVMVQRFSRSGNKIMQYLVKRIEKHLMSVSNTMIFSFSEKDKDIIKKEYNLDSRVTHFFFDEMTLKAEASHIENHYIFFGKWSRADNFDGLKWFFDNVYSHIDNNIHISIIGIGLPHDFSSYIRSLSNVQYLGFVDNPYTLISNAKAVISPIFSGAGVKVKVVESLCCGTPVIGNEIAFEGISKDFKSFMLFANSVEDYLNAINNVNRTLEQRFQFREYFRQEYSSMSISNYLKSL